MHHQAGVNFENATEVEFRDILITEMGHRDRGLNRDIPGQTRTYGRPNLNQNLKSKFNFRFIRERPFAIPSFHQKCRFPEKARSGALPPAAPLWRHWFRDTVTQKNGRLFANSLPCVAGIFHRPVNLHRTAVAFLLHKFC